MSYTETIPEKTGESNSPRLKRGKLDPHSIPLAPASARGQLKFNLHEVEEEVKDVNTGKFMAPTEANLKRFELQKAVSVQGF